MYAGVFEGMDVPGLMADPARAESWTSDQALTASPEGADFAQWFAEGDVGHDWQKYVGSIPLSRVYEVVDEARRRAAAWSAFARMLECRTR